MDKTKTTEELAREMFNNGFFCEYCGHIFSEHEVRTLVE